VRADITRYLLAERSFDQIVIFEQRATTRGVWNYTPETVQDIGQVPQLDANQPVEKPEFKTVKESNGTKKEPFFLTPMYKDLETNIPNMIMQYSDLPFPKGSQLFPSRDSVTDYLDVYAKDVNHLVKFSTQIFDVRLKCGSVQDTWAVKYKDLVSEHEGEMEFDAVVVANGHYNVHYIPQIEGISEWNGKYPGVISHSKYFRSVEAFKGKVRMTSLVTSNTHER
jgi:cation diffusion facilitator CzcD-associated flavoprotein CzcO